MTYKVSGTSQIPKGKAATFGYRPFETDSLGKVVEYINTHAIIPCIVKDGHRKRANVEEILPWIRLDIDKKGEIEKIEKKLYKGGVLYIKKPSTSNADKPWKWHIYIPVTNVSQNYDAYKLQYYAFLSEMGITLSDKSLASVVQNTNPMGESGIALTEIVDGKVWDAPKLTAPKRKDLKKKHSTMGKDEVKKLLSNLDPSMIYHDPGDTGPSWLKVGMALYDWCPKRGFKLFDKWSQGSDKYDGTTRDQWDNFAGSLDGGITMGSLVYWVHGEKSDPTEGFGVEKVKKVKKKKKGVTPEGIFAQYTMTKTDYEGIADQEYLIDGFIPDGGFGIVVGKESSGKSWLCFYLGNRILDQYPQKKMMFFDIDAGAAYSKTRVEYLTAKYPNRFYYQSQHKGLDADEILEGFDELIEMDLSDYIIAIDSLVGMTKGKVNGSDDIKPTLTVMEGLRNAGATVILIHHNKKDGNYAGSYTIAASVDFMYKVTKKDEKLSCELAKDRGAYESHTIQITDFEACEGSETETFVVIDEVDEEKEKIQIKKDKKYINVIRRIITELEEHELQQPVKQMLINNAKLTDSLNKHLVDRILRDYDGVFWTWKPHHNNNGGRPTSVYSLTARVP